jgi:hypothetical protein
MNDAMASSAFLSATTTPPPRRRHHPTTETASATPPRPPGSRGGEDVVEDRASRGRALHLGEGGAGCVFAGGERDGGGG